MAVFGSGIKFTQGKNAVTGIREFDRKLARLSKTGSKRAVRSGMTAGLTPVVAALRSETASITGAASLKATFRKSVGKKVQVKGGIPDAKVGFGVAKKRKGKGVISLPERGKGKGKGIHPAFNIHWPVFGVKNRVQKKTGRVTGDADWEANAKQLPAKALKKSKSKVMAAFAKKVRKVIENVK